MTPILFEHSVTNFDNYGIGALIDAVSCKVTMKDAQYELELQYSINGEWFSELTQQRIIYAKPCQTDNPQPFRIYRITKPINGIVTIYARHVSYDLIGIPILPFTATSASDFATKISQNAAVSCPFTFSTNISNTADLKFNVPTSARSLICGNDPSWKSVYGGELLFDGFTVNLRLSIGENRGMVIRYGVDIIDAKMEENISETYTGILPYYWNEQANTLVTGSVLTATGSFTHTKILPVNLFDYIVETNPTQEKVNEVGQTWLTENMIGLPSIGLSLSYAQIDQIVRLGDAVTVKIEKLGIDVVAKIMQTVYDVLNEKYISVNVGDVTESIYKDIYDASRLKTGLLDMKRIKDGSITSSKLGGGSVKSDKIATAAITEDKIVNRAISKFKLGIGAVGLEELDTVVNEYFDGSRSFPVKASRLVLGRWRIYVDTDGTVRAETTS